LADREAVQEIEVERRQDAKVRRAPSVSIIIPALDEEETLPRCLKGLLGQDYQGAMRVIVVDNGSRDATVAIARQWADGFTAAGHELRVIRLAWANKCAALNAGDAVASGSCRIYLDADAELSRNCISRVVSTLCDGSGIHFCCPRLEVAAARSWITRRYARVWSRLPWVSDDAIGGGFYAVNEAGRRRWGDFPDLLSEDSFAQAQFRRNERRVVSDAKFLIHLPEGFRDLLKVRTRWVSGNRQLARQYSGDWGRAAYPWRGRIKSLLTRPSLWPDMPLYLLINGLAGWKSRRRERLGTSLWERARPPANSYELDDADAATSPPSV
jgi:glycosyltransferase involved in cell wall biosynthesis